MKLLIDSSTSQLSIALIDHNKVLFEDSIQTDRDQHRVIVQPLQEVRKWISLNQLEHILVGSGPGSYSGTRVGIAAAEGFGFVLRCPVIAIPSILAVEPVVSGRRCLAIGDARQGGFWIAVMEQASLLQTPKLVNKQELQDQIDAHIREESIIFSFEARERFAFLEERIACIQPAIPQAKWLAHAWESATHIQCEEWSQKIAEPYYLKPPHISLAKPLKIPGFERERL